MYFYPRALFADAVSLRFRGSSCNTTHGTNNSKHLIKLQRMAACTWLICLSVRQVIEWLHVAGGNPHAQGLLRPADSDRLERCAGRCGAHGVRLGRRDLGLSAVSWAGWCQGLHPSCEGRTRARRRSLRHGIIVINGKKCRANGTRRAGGT